MNLPSEILKQIQESINQNIIQCKLLTHGQAGPCYFLSSQANTSFFLKLSAKETDAFIKEYNGLKSLRKFGQINTPKAYKATHYFLLMEYIQVGHSKDFNIVSKQLAHQVYTLHSYKKTQCGFEEDNYIGATKQINKTSSNITWFEFFWNNRLFYQYKLLEAKGLVDQELYQAFHLLENLYYKIMHSHHPPLSLLHGDLWKGNYLSTSDNDIFFIDPAIYYGDCETDLAMTQLFGGFPNAFYQYYLSLNPLPSGYQKRFVLYNIYHLLNHMNLFGMSYRGHVLNAIEQLKIK